MPIVEFPRVRVSGVDQKIFSIDLSGGGTSPATMKLSFLTGVQVYEPNAEIEIHVSIGNFYNFTGYITAASTNSSARSGRTTELTLIDTSIKLDKIFVGLRGKHGPPQAPMITSDKRNTTVDLFKLSNTPVLTGNTLNTVGNGTLNNLSVFEAHGDFIYKELILIGKAIDPCKNIGEDDLDLCDPCAGVITGLAQRKLDCEKSRSFQILDVDYSFNELIVEAAKRGIYFSNQFLGPVSYRTQYTGTLRDVLTSWCRDYGYSFYWQDGGVQFVNLINGIEINDSALATGCRIEEQGETLSIENNTKNVNIVYFGKAGEIKQYDCNKNQSGDNTPLQPVTLLPISLEQLLIGNTPLITRYGSVNKFRTIVTAGVYSKDLRDTYCWTEIFGYKSPTQVVIGPHILMGWDVKAVCYEDVTEAQVAQGYSIGVCRSLYSNLLHPDSNKGDFFTQENITKLKAAGAYFIVASEVGINKDTKVSNAFTFESEVAESFCGKYWIKSTNEADIEISHPDGTYRILSGFYGNPELILPDLHVRHPYIKSSTSRFLSDLTSANREKTQVIILERPQIWLPDKTDPTTGTFLQAVSETVVREIPYSNSYPGLKENDKLFLVYSFNSSTYPTLTTSVDTRNHPSEVRNTSDIGTTSNQCSYISFEIKPPGKDRIVKFSVYMPTEASYQVRLVRKNSSFRMGPQIVVIPKFEAVFTETNPAKSENCVSISVNYQNITDNDLSRLTSVNNKCFINISNIITTAQAIVGDLSNSQPRIKRSKNYTVLGLPNTQFSPVDGLTSFSVKMDSGGTRTSLAFSNVFPEKVSDAVKRNEFNFLINNQSVKTYLNNTI